MVPAKPQLRLKYFRHWVASICECRYYRCGLSPLNTDNVALQAGVLMMKRVQELAALSIDFGSESTLAARSWVRRIEQLQASGYRFNLFYIWLPSAELAIERVTARVRSGGHDIPEATIRRRYNAGLQNFRKLYLPLADRWRIIDNSRPGFPVIARGGRATDLQIIDADLWRRFSL
jgi:predicted ABC-type ATPase